MSVFRQCVGIDVSKSSFTACFARLTESAELTFSEVHSFTNDSKGYNQLLRWTTKVSQTKGELRFLMEATGVYYEQLANHLHKIKKEVIVVLPNMSKHFASSLNVKTKTDKMDAKILAHFGVERKHRAWQPPSAIYLKLRDLTRYYVQLQEQKTGINNIRTSKEAGHEVEKIILKSNKALVQLFDKQIKQCQSQIKSLIESDKDLKHQVDLLTTIPGVGFMTVATILAETFGFEHFKSAKQLISYSGYDVVQRESGTSVQGKTRISKKGNRYIRNSLFFPAMVACRFNPVMKKKYLNLVKRKSIKMIAQVAIQRKLLALIFALWKNQTEFDANYENKVARSIRTELH